MSEYKGLVVRYDSDGSAKTLIFGDVIGKGGYGEVYKATLDGFGYVAAKVLKLANPAKTAEIAKMLYMECDISTYPLKYAVLLKRYIYNPINSELFSNTRARESTGNAGINFGCESVECPSDIVITIYDFVDGYDLKGDMSLHTSRDLEYSNETVLHYIHMMAKGLVEMANMGIAHRDIKPANFMIQRGKVKYIDFGLACKYEKCVKKAVGTFAYMPDEMFKDNFENFEKADVYALGKTICSFFFNIKSRDFISIRTNEELTRYLIIQMDDRGSLPLLLRDMMNFNVEERLTARQVLERVNEMRGTKWGRFFAKINPFDRSWQRK